MNTLELAVVLDRVEVKALLSLMEIEIYGVIPH